MTSDPTTTPPSVETIYNNNCGMLISTITWLWTTDLYKKYQLPASWSRLPMPEYTGTPLSIEEITPPKK